MEVEEEEEEAHKVVLLQPGDDAVQEVLLGGQTHVPHPEWVRLCRLPALFLTSVQPVDFIFTLSNLRLLDLHSNQLQRLPGNTAWRCLPNLQVLLLHRNYLSSLRNLAALGSLPSLELLTLHHNPVALHPNYREFVLSSVEGLEVLDHHAVADEELMEGARWMCISFCSCFVTSGIG